MNLTLDSWVNCYWQWPTLASAKTDTDQHWLEPRPTLANIERCKERYWQVTHENYFGRLWPTLADLGRDWQTRSQTWTDLDRRIVLWVGQCWPPYHTLWYRFLFPCIVWGMRRSWVQEPEGWRSTHWESQETSPTWDRGRVTIRLSQILLLITLQPSPEGTNTTVSFKCINVRGQQDKIKNDQQPRDVGISASREGAPENFSIYF